MTATRDLRGNERMSGKTSTAELSLSDMREVQMSRTKLEHVVREPYFGKFIRGLFVRICIGPNPRTGDVVYRICEMLGESPRPYRHTYKLLSKPSSVTDKVVLVRHGNNKRYF